MNANRSIAALILATLVAGCATPPAGRTYVDRLIDHPQFKAAARSAPEFTGDALAVVADLEADLRKK